MKKIGIYLMSLLALGFTACDDYDEAQPQTNPQQPLLEMDGVTVAEGADMAQDIDLNTFAGDSLELIATTATPELNPGVTVAYDVQLSATADFAAPATVALSNGKIAKTDLDNAFRSFYGKTPKAKAVYMRFAAYMTDGQSRVRIGDASKYFVLPVTPNIKPIDLGITVESKYYVLLDTYFGTGWDKSMVELTRADANADVYDDPVFSGIITTTGDPIQIIGADGVAAAQKNPDDGINQAWGGPDANAMSGTLVQGADARPIALSAGMYRVTVNMLERTYSIVAYSPEMYMIGKFCEWSWDNAGTMVKGYSNTAAAGKFWILRYVGAGSGNGFKFNNEKAWGGGEIGFSNATLVSNVAGVNFVDDGGNIAVDKAGWYLFGVETSNAGTKVLLFEPAVYVYGDCAGGKWEDTAEWKFTVPTTADGEFVSPALAADGELRLCVHPLLADGSQWIGDWWQSEFIFFDGKIAYRETGGDQNRVKLQAGQKVYLNFITGAAEAK